MLAEPRRLQRCLNVHLEISKVREELRVCLRLIPTAHDSKRYARIAFLRKRGNNRVQRPLPSCQSVGRRGVKRKESAAIVEGKTGSGRHDARSKRFVIALNE